MLIHLIEPWVELKLLLSQQIFVSNREYDPQASSSVLYIFFLHCIVAHLHRASSIFIVLNSTTLKDVSDESLGSIEHATPPCQVNSCNGQIEY